MSLVLATEKDFYNNEEVSDVRDPKIKLIEIKGRQYFLKTHKNISRKYLIRKKPACFDTLNIWQEWLYYAIVSKLEVKRYCADCQKGFREEMKKSGKCKYKRRISNAII